MMQFAVVFHATQYPYFGLLLFVAALRTSCPTELWPVSMWCHCVTIFRQRHYICNDLENKGRRSSTHNIQKAFLLAQDSIFVKVHSDRIYRVLHTSCEITLTRSFAKSISQALLQHFCPPRSSTPVPQLSHDAVAGDGKWTPGWRGGPTSTSGQLPKAEPWEERASTDIQGYGFICKNCNT